MESGSSLLSVRPQQVLRQWYRQARPSKGKRRGGSRGPATRKPCALGSDRWSLQVPLYDLCARVALQFSCVFIRVEVAPEVVGIYLRYRAGKAPNRLNRLTQTRMGQTDPYELICDRNGDRREELNRSLPMVDTTRHRARSGQILV